MPVSFEHCKVEEDISLINYYPRTFFLMCLFYEIYGFSSELNALEMDMMISHVQSWVNDHSTPQESAPNDLYSNVLILEGFRMFALR
jgi:hypothetical protein